MQKESSLVDAAKSALAFAQSQKAKAGKAISKAYRPIKSISPLAIGGGLAAGHVAGGYSGSAAAQVDMYHLGRTDQLKKQAGVSEFVRSGISGARGFVTRTGNTARSSALAKRVGGAIKANPIKSSVAIGTASGLAVSGGMQKSSGLYSRALAFARLKGRTNPLATKIVAGTTAAGVGLGVTHVADEHLDGAAGRAAVYNYRKQNGSI
jgi:hypothetical protein